MIIVGAALLSLGVTALPDRSPVRRRDRRISSPTLSKTRLLKSRAAAGSGSSGRRSSARCGLRPFPGSSVNAASIRQMHYAHAYTHGNGQNVTSGCNRAAVEQRIVADLVGQCDLANLEAPARGDGEPRVRSNPSFGQMPIRGLLPSTDAGAPIGTDRARPVPTVGAQRQVVSRRRGEEGAEGTITPPGRAPRAQVLRCALAPDGSCGSQRL
jgi:hypothetical protein